MLLCCRLSLVDMVYSQKENVFTNHEKGKTNMKIAITKNGPYIVDAGVPVKEVNSLANKDGAVLAYEEKKDLSDAKANTYLCRCGHSANKPFCDGHHAKIGFDGTETNDRKSYDHGAELLQGKVYDALDKPELCAAARFCDVGAGFWNALHSMDEADKKYVEHVACTCPSGRLTLVDKHTGQKMEPELEKEIYLVNDVPAGHLGPIYAKGGIQVTGADGFAYEVRNRVTLCRCGESRNLPFCDASHLRCEHMEVE